MHASAERHHQHPLDNMILPPSSELPRRQNFTLQHLRASFSERNFRPEGFLLMFDHPQVSREARRSRYFGRTRSRRVVSLRSQIIREMSSTRGKRIIKERSKNCMTVAISRVHATTNDCESRPRSTVEGTMCGKAN